MYWWLRRVVDFFTWFAALLYGRKYAVLAGELGREGATAVDAPRRFLAIQIDGLAHADLLHVLAEGAAPTIQRLIEQGHRLQRWRCGLPSATPAVQAGIMYGDNWDIPAFRWYEKESGFAPVAKVPAHIERIQARVAGGKPGILSGGSSYSNMMDGGARLALFTLTAMGRQRFFEHLRGIGWALLMILIPWRVLRIVGLTAWELTRDIGKSLGLWLRGGLRGRPRLIEPFLEVMANVVLGEVMAFGAALDIYKGIPAIYVTFYGYDEVAHTAGTRARASLHALKRIDGHIRELDRLRRLYRPDMDLYILSDHGMSSCRPFHELNGGSLSALIASCVGNATTWDDTWDPDVADSASLRFLLDELDGIEAHLSPRGRRLVRAMRRRIERKAPVFDDREWDLARGSDVVVRASGGLVHIYFNVTEARMDVSEAALLYPTLLDTLVDHPGVGLVLGVEDGRPVIVTGRGTVGLAADQLPPGLDEPELAAADLARLLSFPHCGDLMIVGAWDHGQIITFEDQAATHGSVGGPQGYPFFLVPPNIPLDLSDITSARQLYPFFMAQYHRVETSEQVGK
jgi:hypothetical protein